MTSTPKIMAIGAALLAPWTYAAGVMEPTPTERAMLEGRTGVAFRHSAVVWRAATTVVPEEWVAAFVTSLDSAPSSTRTARKKVVVRPSGATIAPSWRTAERGGAKFISRN